MPKFFELSEEQRRLVITQTANKIGLPSQAVEKDLWVTVMLHVIFTLPFADRLVFKGGTSLSKVHHLIERFSEDIDLAIDRSIFGLEGDLTKKQTKKLRKASSLFVKETICPELEEAIKHFGLETYCRAEAEPDGEGDKTYPEPRKIHIYYKSLFAPIPYLQPEVQLEIGSRSLFEPTEQVEVGSLITSTFPQIDTQVTLPMTITTAVPEKTFLEKAFLLHELFTTDRALVANRKSRHLYDLEKMTDEPFAMKAITDDNLWNTIAHHREVFTSIRGVDYTPDIRDRICLTPPANAIDIWAQDYKDMQDAMIFGSSLPFENLLGRMRELENRFHNRQAR